jgi:hypothetical protein
VAAPSPRRASLLVLTHLRKGETHADLAGGFGTGTSTVYRCLRQALDLLAALGPMLKPAIEVAAGKAYVILDGTLLRIDRRAICRAGRPRSRERWTLNRNVRLTDEPRTDSGRVVPQVATDTMPLRPKTLPTPLVEGLHRDAEVRGYIGRCPQWFGARAVHGLRLICRPTRVASAPRSHLERTRAPLAGFSVPWMTELPGSTVDLV